MRGLESLFEGMCESGLQGEQELYQSVWDVMMEIPSFSNIKDSAFARIAGALANDEQFKKEAQSYVEDDGAYNFDPDFIRMKAFDKMKELATLRR